VDRDDREQRETWTKQAKERPRISKCMSRVESFVFVVLSTNQPHKSDQGKIASPKNDFRKNSP
jgi:hypothetical protein